MEFWNKYELLCILLFCVGNHPKLPFIRFGAVWLGFLNSFWKSIILITLSPQFRLALRIFCMTICCRYKGRMQAELIGKQTNQFNVFNHTVLIYNFYRNGTGRLTTLSRRSLFPAYKKNNPIHGTRHKRLRIFQSKVSETLSNVNRVGLISMLSRRVIF